MKDLERLLATCLFEINECVELKKLENIRVAIVGKNGKITEKLRALKDIPADERKTAGEEINRMKNEVLTALEKRRGEIEIKNLESKLSSEFIDVSMPHRSFDVGTIHPLTKVEQELSEILSSLGFVFAEGPDIESEYYNFTALNMPDHHPARTMHDTFYINVLADQNGRKLLRTHTSPVQIRSMNANHAPMRFFSIGRVFRSDYDATHTPMFNQLEGIIIEKNIGFSHLKWLLITIVKKFFEIEDLKIRLRPSFFPFTEPSVEVDINYDIKNGKMLFGAGEKWLEILGAGVIHPNVLKAGSVDSNAFRGLAFGFGLERMASLKYGIPDLRGYFESDHKWRQSFGFKYCYR